MIEKLIPILKRVKRDLLSYYNATKTFNYQYVRTRKFYKDNPNPYMEGVLVHWQLKPESIVFDIGGYRGGWSRAISEKYNSKIFIFEPVSQYCLQIRKRFKANKRVQIFNFGLMDTTSHEDINVNEDASSLFRQKGGKSQNTLSVEFRDINLFIRGYNIKHIDLVKINIEGGEYPLLKKMIDEKIVEKCTNILIQFHTFYPRARKLRKEIRNSLKETHFLVFNYPFVWENWKKK